jgi:hypothetical protein
MLTWTTKKNFKLGTKHDWEEEQMKRKIHTQPFRTREE